MCSNTIHILKGEKLMGITFVEAGTRISSEVDKFNTIKSNCANIIADAVKERAKSGDVTSKIQKDIKNLLSQFSSDDAVDVEAMAIQILATELAKYTAGGKKSKKSSSVGNWGDYDDDYEDDEEERPAPRRRSGNIFRN